ncbi:MAG: phage tail protein, partial [Solirubrobacteraceae bacterium]
AKAKAHQPAAAGAASAQAAAQPPANEVASQAAGAQVEEMGKQQPGTFDKKAFIAAVKKAIDAAAPKNLEEADDFKDSGKAAQVKGEVGALVKGGKKESEKDIKQATDAPPDASKAKPKPVTPMVNEQAGQAPAGVGAAEAMPGPRPAEDTDLSAGPAEIEAQMGEAGVTDEQLRNSNEPEFNAAVDAKDTAKEHAAQAPGEYRAKEQDVLAKSRDEAEATAGVQLEGMHGSKIAALAKVAGQKTEAKSADEAKRAKVATDIQAIYDRTKADVTAILDGLDPKVDAAFTRGEESARKQFEDFVGAKMDAYKEDRYSGFFGGARWLKDKLFGMPDEVNVFYSQGRTAYLAAMDGVIGEVADIVGNELNAARVRIAEGRAEVRNFVAQLPTDLQQVGKDAEDKLESQFEQLSSDVDSKQDAMVDSLAQKYVEARGALDERIEELKAANRGLVAKALDAVVGVLKTIWKLKDMLLNVLAKAADVITDIITDPIGFLGRLIDGVKSGLNRFVDNIGAHLEKGLMGWLFGTLGDAGIQLPKTFDLTGIFELVMQILGLTYQRIRGKIAKIVGEPVVEKMEQVVDVFKTLATKGIAGLWEWIKDKVGDFQELVLGGIKSFIIERVIKGGVMWLLALLNPAAAFVKACIAIYDIVMFIVERGQEIMEFVNSILDSIGAIARGNISIVAEKVEDALSRALPLAISFLAGLLRLGGISEKIRETIELIRKPIDKAINFIVMGAVKGFKKLFGGAIGWVKGKYEKGKQWAKAKVEAGKEWAAGKVKSVKDRITGKGGEEEGAAPAAGAAEGESKDVETGFSMAGKPHTLTATSDGGRARVVMSSSNPGDLIAKADTARAAAEKGGNPAAAAALQAFIDESQPKLDQLALIEAGEQQEASKEAAKVRLLRGMAADLVKIGTDHNLKDLAYGDLGLEDVELNRLVYAALMDARKEILARGQAAAAQPEAEADAADLSRAFDALLHRTANAYGRACGARVGAKEDAAGFRGNVFTFAGHDYFVDHEANYILPNERVAGNRGKLRDKVYVASKPVLADESDLKSDKQRALIEDYAYTGVTTTADKFKSDALNLAAGIEMDPEAGALFLAAMIAEVKRNPNAHVTNLLLISEGGKGPFFGAAPMTTGGTSAAEKPRDPTLATLPGNLPGEQPPMTVTDAEIRLVRQRYEKDQNTDLAEEFKVLDKEKLREHLTQFLVAEGKL